MEPGYMGDINGPGGDPGVPHSGESKHIIRAGNYYGKPAYWTGEGWSRDPREAHEYERWEGSSVLKNMMADGYKTVQLLERIEEENK